MTSESSTSSGRPLSVVVYPHAMEIGGSQLNAVELAAAVRDRGHDVAVYSEDGPLLERVAELGLTHLARHAARRTPSSARSLDLAGVARDRGVDVLHGYEWPPILECYAASGLVRGSVAVGTVMSMAVAPFLPPRLPLVVGTERIRASVGPRPGAVDVIEPPVDTDANRPGTQQGAEFACAWPVEADTVRVVLVGRLVPELKLEGVLSAVRAVRLLAGRPGPRVHLSIVGGGSATDEVARAAAAANDGLDAPVVTLTGELSDPRGAYASADIAIAMGGSALRSLAFATPLVVQGEGGFFEVLDEQSLPLFLDQGFYGTGTRGEDEAAEHLAGLLAGLAADTARRDRLGRWGRVLVEDRFSLKAAAAVQEDLYRRALAARPAPHLWLAGGVRSGPPLLAHKVARRRESRRGVVARDDFNARPA